MEFFLVSFNEKFKISLSWFNLSSAMYKISKYKYCTIKCIDTNKSWIIRINIHILAEVRERNFFRRIPKKTEKLDFIQDRSFENAITVSISYEPLKTEPRKRNGKQRKQRIFQSKDETVPFQETGKLNPRQRVIKLISRCKIE